MIYKLILYFIRGREGKTERQTDKSIDRKTVGQMHDRGTEISLKLNRFTNL